MKPPKLTYDSKRTCRSISVTHRRARSEKSFSMKSNKNKKFKRPSSVNKTMRSRSRHASIKSHKSKKRSRTRDEIGKDGMSAALRKAITGPRRNREKSEIKRLRSKRRSESIK